MEGPGLSGAGLKVAAQGTWKNVAQSVITLSNEIHARPETAFEEFYAAACICDVLERHCFGIERETCGLPTAFIATYGVGSLVVAFCAEYDALPGIGHACGHNMIASASVGAALILQPIADLLDLTVKVIGTPGEEWGEGGGKITLLEGGGFDGVHIAMMVHPAPFDSLDINYVAATRLEVTFKAASSYTSYGEGVGGNALHAITLAQVAVGLLGNTLDAYSRINGVVSEGGGSPNVAPDSTTAIYLIRARTLQDIKHLQQRVLRCFEASALATGCEYAVTGGEKPYAEMHQNPLLLSLYKRNAEQRGRSFSPARGIHVGGPSTDMGNISLVIPSIHPCIGIGSWPVTNHQPPFAQHCIGSNAERVVEDAALLMAATVIDVALSGDIRETLSGPQPA